MSRFRASAATRALIRPYPCMTITKAAMRVLVQAAVAFRADLQSDVSIHGDSSRRARLLALRIRGL